MCWNVGKSNSGRSSTETVENLEHVVEVAIEIVAEAVKGRRSRNNRRCSCRRSRYRRRSSTCIRRRSSTFIREVVVHVSEK